MYVSFVISDQNIINQKYIGIPGTDKPSVVIDNLWYLITMGYKL